MLRLQQEADQARTGYELLDHKREVLVHELLQMVDEAERSQRESTARFRAAYEALVEARARWLEVAEQLGRLAETTTTVWRLATELQQTQRRVNALEHILIPELEATIQHITDVLEEHDREAFVRAKRVKSMQQSDQE